MRIAIYTRDLNGIGAKLLAAAADKLGHEAVLTDFVSAEARQAGLDSDCFIPRFGHLGYRTAIEAAKQFAAHNPDGVLAVDAAGIKASFDKLATYQRLRSAGIPTPITHELSNKTDLNDLATHLPLILKPIDENRGRGIVMVRSLNELRTAVRELLQTYGRGIAQEFIAEAAGRDIRAFVIGDEVVAAMERSAPEGSLLANLSQGGSARPIELTHQEQDLAVRVAHLFGAAYAGVDMLRGTAGPLVLELNASPGFKIAGITQVDVPALVIEHLTNMYEGEEE